MSTISEGTSDAASIRARSLRQVWRAVAAQQRQLMDDAELRNIQATIVKDR